MTILITATPLVGFGYHNPSVHLVVSAVESCVALLVAYLVYGRFLRRSRLQDLLLAQGLVLLAVAGFALTFGTEIWPAASSGTSEIWYPLALRLFGTVLITASALVDDRVVTSRLAPRLLLLYPPLAAVAIVAVLSMLQIELPVAFDAGYVPTSAQHPFLTAHGMLIAIQLAAAAGLLVASVKFTLASRHREDHLLRWLGPACALGGFARLNYVLFPSLYTDWIYTGDVLRFGCYLLLLIGATREIGQYWAAQAGAAVSEDRRRLARELHDGVVQELALIRMEGRSLSAHPTGDRIVRACDRALDEVRAALQALGHGADEPLSTVLHRAAAELGGRLGVQVVLDLDETIAPTEEQQHALMRITREAITNAVRHGGARTVHVQLYEHGGERCLVIGDDGRGFDRSAVPAAAGYGMVSMRDRARALPGSFDVHSRPGAGTKVIVKW